MPQRSGSINSNRVNLKEGKVIEQKSGRGHREQKVLQVFPTRISDLGNIKKVIERMDSDTASFEGSLVSISSRRYKEQEMKRFKKKGKVC